MIGTAAAVAVMFAAALDHVKTVAGYRAIASDYVQDYLAARAWRAGASLYAPIPEDPAVAPVFDTGGTVLCDHPPPYVLALAPVSLLPYGMAFTALGYASILAAAVGGWLVARELRLSFAGTCGAVAVVLVHPGVHTCLWAGNVSLLLGLAVVFAWVAARRGADGWAGFWVGLATVIKLYPGLLLVAFLVGRRWRSVGTFAATVAAGAAASLALAGWDDHADYLTRRGPDNARLYRGHGFNLSWAGVAHRMFGEPCERSLWLDRAAVEPELASAVAVGGQVVILGIALVTAWRGRRDERAPDRLFAVLIPAMLLLSPLTWLHAVVLALLPAAVLFASTPPRPRWRFALLVLSTALLFVPDRWVAQEMMNRTGRDRIPAAANVVLLGPTWGLLGLLAAAAVSATSSSAVGPPRTRRPAAT